jgi:hypothetical protein
MNHTSRFLYRQENMTDDDIFSDMMRVYPHEFYVLDPERFWRLYSAKWPDCKREDMERALRDTDEDNILKDRKI